jgi:tRNA (mo5U34)-methyltransferase
VYPDFLRAAEDTPLAPFAAQLLDRSERVWSDRPHGDLDRWRQAVDALPQIDGGRLDLNAAAVGVRSQHGSPDQQQRVREGLQALHPWRKGPFHIHGIDIDSEWRCDLKWARLEQQISPLRGRLVLDVGCGNGYYGWRMLGADARLVLGIDPTQLFMLQFDAIRHFVARPGLPLWLLPLGIEQLPHEMPVFDSVFSMGVFYHRRSPFDHLAELRNCLRSGGELILETLVIMGGEGRVLVPANRYAKMRNVWFIPSADTLLHWLARAGFRHPRIIDISPTRVDEQRSTPWMRFESLADYLHPDDDQRTIEGYPAPVRGLFLAEK